MEKLYYNYIVIVKNIFYKGGIFMILMIDNYDSFVYNLVQYMGELGEEILVKRNNEIT